MPQGSWSDSNHVPQHSGVDASQAQSSLFGVDAIVNCAGTLQDAPGDSTAGVHHKGVASLIAACEKMGVRRFIHLSAIGVDRARVELYRYGQTLPPLDATLIPSHRVMVFKPSAVLKQRLGYFSGVRRIAF